MANLALSGGPKTRREDYPKWPSFDEAERAALSRVLESRKWWRTAGNEVERLEAAFSAYQQAKHGVAMSNGTHALEAALLALEVGPGHEVIVPDLTFVATAGAVLCAGALPVFVDIRPDTLCVDPEQVGRAIGPRTRAVIAVHLGGHPADLDALVALCRKRNLYLIEDSSHAHSTEFQGRKVGAIGDLGTFSFQAGKTMTAGEGGIVLTNDPDLAAKVRSVHDCGRYPNEAAYAHHLYGSNYRMTEWQGAVLSAQLERLDEQSRTRHRNAELLDGLLAEIDGITPQHSDPRCTLNGHYSYIFRYEPNQFGGMSSKRFREALEAEGIPTQESYPPVHALDLFASGAFAARLGRRPSGGQLRQLRRPRPVTEQAAAQTVWLRHRALLGSEEDTRDIATAVRKLRDHYREIQ